MPSDISNQVLMQFGTINHANSITDVLQVDFPIAFSNTSYGFCAISQWLTKQFVWTDYSNVTMSSIEVSWNGYNSRASSNHFKYLVVGF